MNQVRPIAVPVPLTAAREVMTMRLEQMRLLTLRALRRAGADGPAVELELAAVERALAQATPGRDAALARRLRLGADELDLLWLAVALGADPRLEPQAVALGGTEIRRGVTLPLLSAVTGLPSDRAQALAMRLGPAHPLLHHGLLEIADGERVMTPYRAARRLIGHLAGDAEIDPPLAEIPIPDELELDPTARRHLTGLLATGEEVLVVLGGPTGAGRRTLAACAARELGRSAVVLDLERLPPTLAALEPALLALRREHLLSGALPVIAGLGDLTADREGAVRSRAIERAIDAIPGAVVVTGESDLRPRRPAVALEVPLPGPAARRTLWSRALGGCGAELDELAIRYRLTAGDVHKAAAAGRLAARARGSTEPLRRELTDGVRATIRRRLGGLAERIEVKPAWEDLILPDDVRGQLDDLIGRVRGAYQVLESWRFGEITARGGGLAALFSGPPGTGKTMAAGLVARALDLELYQVDLSAIVSKWIGETEKNLSRLFEAADAGHALLLFDEADALFARRTEVKGSNDRHANLEVNHLLTRIEAFGGVAILTTNMDASLDPALRRRLAARIELWPPDEDERAALWRRMLGGRAPLAPDVDAARLARRFAALTGGTIRNAVVAAAFRAAAERSPITQALLERAAADEYRTMGRICSEETRR